MNQPITLQRMSTTQDSVGQQTRTWTQIGHSIAAINPISGREYFNASGEKADITHEIRIRVDVGLSLVPRDRVLFGSRSFDIQSVINTGERDREWVLMCIESLHTL